MEYTLGFMFSKEGDKVLLIQKDRPKWQAGKLNGIGGKIDHFLDSESDLRTTQVREFHEETTIGTAIEEWELFAIITGTETEDKTGTEVGSTYNIYCYRCFSDKMFEAAQIESEIPTIISSFRTHEWNCLTNVNWLVPMALYHQGSVLKINYNG